MPEVHALTPWTIINDILPGVQLGKFFRNSRLTKSQDLKFVDAIIKKYYGGDQGEHARKRTANRKHNLWPN